MLSLVLFACWIVTLVSLPPLDDDQLRKVNTLDEFFNGKRKRRMAKNKKIPLDKNKDIITSVKPHKYVMNMDDSVDIRWGALCMEHRDNYVQIYEYINGVLTQLGVLETFYAIVMDWFTQHVSEPYKSEIEYFANCTDVPLRGAVALNLMEILTVVGCTSVVGVDDKNIVFHGRNLDLWLEDIQSALRAMIINVEYTSNGNTLFRGSTFFGFSGVHVGVQAAGFSISQNTRYSHGLIDNLMALQQGFYPSTWLLRDVLSNSESYEEALNELRNTPLITACYLTIGGVRYPQGAVVTRNHTHSINLFSLADSYLEWFVAVTNDDWWVEEPSDERRDAVIQNMNKVTQSKLKANTMDSVLRQVPTINFGTISTSVLSASRGTATMHRTTVVELTVLEDDKDEEQEPVLLVAQHGLDDGAKEVDNDSNDSKWTTIGSGMFIILCILFNITMCTTYLCFSGSKKYAKVSEEVLMLMDGDFDDDTEEEMI